MASIGCSLLGQLDSLGGKEPSWAFRPFWQRGPAIGPEDPDNPGFDKDGNLLPPPEVSATYLLPPVTAGIHFPVNEPRVVPTVGVKMFDAKTPYVRWLDGQLFAGQDLIGFYIGKRWTSIYEVTTGPFIGYDFEVRNVVWGFGFTLSKF